MTSIELSQSRLLSSVMQPRVRRRTRRIRINVREDNVIKKLILLL